MSKNDVIAERIWMTKENDGFQLFEYANKAAYRNNIPSKVYRMQFPFKVSPNRACDKKSLRRLTLLHITLLPGQRTCCLQRILLLLSKGWTENCEIRLNVWQAGRWGLVGISRYLWPETISLKRQFIHHGFRSLPQAWRSLISPRPITQTISTPLSTIWWISMRMITDYGWFIPQPILIIQSLPCWIRRRLKQFIVLISA